VSYLTDDRSEGKLNFKKLQQSCITSLVTVLNNYYTTLHCHCHSPRGAIELTACAAGHVVSSRQRHQITRKPQEFQLRGRQPVRAEAHRLRPSVAARPQRPAGRRGRLRLLPRSVDSARTRLFW